MRRLKKWVVLVISILLFTFTLWFNSTLIKGCVSGYYEGIYFVGVVMSVTFTSILFPMLVCGLKEMRF